VMPHRMPTSRVISTPGRPTSARISRNTEMMPAHHRPPGAKDANSSRPEPMAANARRKLRIRSVMRNGSTSSMLKGRSPAWPAGVAVAVGAAPPVLADEPAPGMCDDRADGDAPGMWDEDDDAPAAE